jgi:hypothetical protein
MDDIERTERIRMATQAREAIAINESKGLRVPPRWREWARVDQGLHAAFLSAASAPSANSAFNSDPQDTS